VWDLAQGAGQTVAVLDSGVSAAAPALAGAVLPGLDVATGKPVSTDCTGHGTFVAGLIAARPTAGSGFAGVAPQARILPVNVINSNGDATPAAVAAGVSFALAHGATVIDVCPAVTPGPSPALASAVATALARNVVVIAPVGAAGLNNSNQVSYPASYPGVIAVTATDSSGTPVAGAGVGVGVDLAAPGSGVTSIGPLGPGEITATGAALATGFVAGAAALVRSYYPRLSAAQVTQRLEVTANPPGDALPDPQVGYGIVAPYTAVATVLPAESGGGAPPLSQAPAVHLAPPAQPDPWPGTAALLICSGVAIGLVAGVAGAHILRNGRRRQWRPPVSSA
jgi:type VII secretion-associated serine protease mycosin